MRNDQVLRHEGKIAPLPLRWTFVAKDIIS